MGHADPHFIAALTIGVNLVGDAVSQSLGAGCMSVADTASGSPLAPRHLAVSGADTSRSRCGRDNQWCRDVSFDLDDGEALGLVGESGSGKTTTGFALLGYARPGMEIVGGVIEIDGMRVELADEPRMRGLRGRVISHVPQDPATDLNPSLRIAGSVGDLVELGAVGEHSDAVGRALEQVHLAANRGSSGAAFPIRFRGGQQDASPLLMALAREPRLLVLDEPTTGLDVATQSRVLARSPAHRAPYHRRCTSAMTWRSSRRLLT